MKKILVILLLQMAIAFNVFAQGEGDRIVNPTWKLSSGALTPTVSTWTLTLPATTFSTNIYMAKTTSTAGIIYSNGTRFMHSYDSNDSSSVIGRNIFIGLGAGNFTSGARGGATTLASFNNGFGYQTLKATTSAASNNAFGYTALANATTGGNNNAFGTSALLANTTGIHNTAIGSNSLTANVGGNYNVAVGGSALKTNISGADNVAVGYIALNLNTASNGTAVGSNALKANTTGADNGAFGKSALQNNIDGYSNSAFGTSALITNTSGYDNSAFGNLSLYANTVGWGNSAFGWNALHDMVDGIENTAVGISSMINNTGGDYNSAIGGGAFEDMTLGSNNTANGFRSIQHVLLGDYNTGVGAYCGQTITGGATSLLYADSSIYVGAQTKAKADNAINETVIGTGATGAGSNTVTIGNANVTDVYLSEDSAATVHAGSANFNGALTAVGTLTMPTPFTLGATSVTTTGTKLNYLTSATGTTGTATTNLVFSTNPVLVTPTLGAATGTTLTLANQSAIQATIANDYARIYPYDDGSNVKVMALLDDSGTETTTQIATANMWGEPSGGAILNGTTQYYSHPDNDNLDFGTGSFSIELWAKVTAKATTQSLITKGDSYGAGADGFSVYLYSNTVRVSVAGGTVSSSTASYTAITNNKWFLLGVCVDRANNLVYFYNDGILTDTKSTSYTTETATNALPLYLGVRANATANHFGGQITKTSFYNYVLTQSEVSRRWNNGQPHLYVEPYATKNANNTMVATYDSSATHDSTITLTTRKDYYWVKGSADSISVGTTKYIASTKISYVSGTVRAKGDLTGSTLKLAGETFSIANTDWGASGAVCTIGGTKSIANSTAYPIAVSGKYDARKTIAANREFTNTAKVGSILKYVKIKNTVAGADTVSLGTTGGGFEVLNAQIVGASSTVIANVAKWFSDSAQQTLFLHATNWATDTLDVVLIYEPIGDKQ